jgi:L-asparagine transporter-like permease
MNVFILYFFPESKKGNGMGVFNAWEQSKSNPQVHQLLKYLVNWVAGTKVIFLALITVILITGSYMTQLLAVIVMIPSILTFYWRLFPLIRSMDQENQINPAGYSKTLAYMIAGFVSIFIIALIITLI